jgi:hypothetical protein
MDLLPVKQLICQTVCQRGVAILQDGLMDKWMDGQKVCTDFNVEKNKLVTCHKHSNFLYKKIRSKITILQLILL